MFTPYQADRIVSALAKDQKNLRDVARKLEQLSMYRQASTMIAKSDELDRLISNISDYTKGAPRIID